MLKLLPHAEILRYEEILRVVSVAAALGISHIRITGGEPLMRREITAFIGALKSATGIEDISLTTNGVLLADMASALRSAGITRLNISLDSLKPERFSEITGSRRWSDVWRGINAAEKAGFDPIKINMVPVKGVNIDEVSDFARLTLARALHVRFIEFMPIGPNDHWQRDDCVSGGQVREIIEREFGLLDPLSAMHSAGPSDNYRIPGARGVIGFISPISRHFCASCRRLRLTADGKIRPCLLSGAEIDVKSPLRGGCGKEELERLLRAALDIKPERHYIGQHGSAGGKRTMSRIGG